MSETTYDYAWITRNRISVGHVRALSKMLNDLSALDASAVRIFAMAPGSVLEQEGQTFREEDSPAQGFLIEL